MGLFDFFSREKKEQNQVSQTTTKNEIKGRWTEKISLETIFRKSVSFHVERFEEWQAGQCINADNIDFDIHLIANDDKITVNIPNSTRFRMHKTVDFNFAVSDVLSDRIQYINNPDQSTDPTLPIILHIFVKNGAIDYIRFAMSFPDRLIELYGYQIISDTSNPDNFAKITNKTESNISPNKPLTDTEKFVQQALVQLSLGNDGDAVYHPLYNAWRSFQNNPDQLKHINDYENYGMGLMIFLTYGTVSDINIKQQIASISYLFISKAINESPRNINLYKKRLMLMISNHDALEYTISSVVNKGDSLIFMNFNPFKARDAMYKMEFSDILKDRQLLSINIIAERYSDLVLKIASGFFGADHKDANIIVHEGTSLHNDVLTYLEDKVITQGNVDF